MKKSNKELEFLLNEIFKEGNIVFSLSREVFRRKNNRQIRATKGSSYEEYIQFLRDNKKDGRSTFCLNY